MRQGLESLLDCWTVGLLDCWTVGLLEREYVAPQITAYVPLLPACNASLLGLPNPIGVELIDLPGLKSVQDRTNEIQLKKLCVPLYSLPPKGRQHRYPYEWGGIIGRCAILGVSLR